MFPPAEGSLIAQATAHHRAGRLREAQDLYEQILIQSPDHHAVREMLGAVLLQLGDASAAEAQLARVIAHMATPSAVNNYAAALAAQGKFEQAIAQLQFITQINPAYAAGHSNLGALCLQLGQLEPAIAAFRRALELEPTAQNNLHLGRALADARCTTDAIVIYQSALNQWPDETQLHHDLAFAQLLAGDYAAAWPHYEYRLQLAGSHFADRTFNCPRWDGAPIGGQTLLLIAEQGLGDTIQYLRYLPLCAQRAGRIMLECPASLHRLIAASFPSIQIISREPSPPPHDFYAPLASLPLIFQTALDTIPASSYLRADSAAVAAWRKRLAPHGSKLRVGLAWAGNPHNTRDARRSIATDMLAPLASCDVTLVNLQVNRPAAELPPALTARMIDWTSELTDFADTAALISALDLVITVDTAIAHLTGALAQAGWVLLNYSADWRWHVDRPDSLWYPSLGLFRQRRPGDWRTVIAQVCSAFPEK